MVITHFLVLNNLRLVSTLFHLDVNLDSGDGTGWNRKQQELQRIMTLINSELEKTDGNVLKCDAVESHSELSACSSFRRFVSSLRALRKTYAFSSKPLTLPVVCLYPTCIKILYFCMLNNELFTIFFPSCFMVDRSVELL